eukprot:scaffold668_cov124-Skeletonema_marinoi.AAC.4
MDYSSSRERRRAAAVSRRAARSSDNTNINNGTSSNSGFNTTDEEPIHQQHNYSRIKTTPPRHSNSNNKRQPLEKSFLSSLSRALTNIDRHNNDYFSSSSDTANNNHNTHNNGTMDNHRDQDNTLSISINKTYTPKQSKQLLRPPTTFKSYINFTTLTIYSLLLFTSCYLLLLFCTLPMISYSNIDTLPTDDDVNGANQHVQKGASFQRIRGRRQYQHIKEQLGTLKDRAVQWEELAKVSAQHEAEELQEKERSLLDKMTIGKRSNREDVMRVSQLLDEVVEEFEGEVEDHREGLVGNRGHDEHWIQSLEAWDQAVGIEETNDEEGEDDDDEVDAMDSNNGNGNKRPGFIVLGMHRSGTSMLSGLLVEGFGYETGGPLIMPNFDNEKGFYERIDVVLQNDAFFAAQGMGWSYNVLKYDSEKALRDKLQGMINFDEGKRALQFLNNHHKTLPYLQKDPRMCIALPTWLKLLDDEPAIVFTYRHPLEVAMSLKKRESSITLEHGLRLWIVYNMRAIQNSARLCRVFSTNEAVMTDPAREVQRIKNQLTDTCNVIPPPKSLMPQEVVDSFIDPNLQHNSKERRNEEKTSSILKDFGDGCVAKEFDREYKKGSDNYEAETQIFLMAMQIFCDFENGKAYEADYEWPDLAHWQRPARIN